MVRVLKAIGFVLSTFVGAFTVPLMESAKKKEAASRSSFAESFAKLRASRAEWEVRFGPILVPVPADAMFRQLISGMETSSAHQLVSRAGRPEPRVGWFR